MTNTINKVLAVFLSVASIVFLALSVAYYSGGTNWRSEMRAEDLKEFSFQLEDGEPTGTWKVTANDPKTGNDRQVASVPENRLSEAILKARKDLETRQRAELTKINDTLPAVEAELARLETLEAADTEAIRARFEQLDGTWVEEGEGEARTKRKDKLGMLDNLAQAVLDVSGVLSKRISDTTAARTDAENRRKDVFRLTNELEVLRTDRARLIELRRELADELLRLQITNASLKQRVDQLPGN